MSIERLIINIEFINKTIDGFIQKITPQIIEASIQHINHNSVLQFVIIDKLDEMNHYLENSDILSINENMIEMSYLLTLLKTKSNNEFIVTINNIKKIYTNISNIICINEFIKTNYEISNNKKKEYAQLTVLSNRYRTNHKYPLEVLKDMINSIKNNNNDDELFADSL